MYLPVALLLCVFLLQVTLTQTHHLTPWKGGGFGMFSVTVKRDVEVQVSDAKGNTLPLDTRSIWEHKRRLMRRVLAMPTDALLCHLAQYIAESDVERIAFEQSALFDHHQRAWWRVHGRQSEDASLRLKERSAPYLMLREPSRALSGAQPDAFIPAEVRIRMRRLEVSLEPLTLVRGELSPGVRWHEGTCEVLP